METCPSSVCPTCGCPATRLAVGFSRWFAEHAGVIPRVLVFCHNGETACNGSALNQLVWMPFEEALNFEETLQLSKLPLTQKAARDLGHLIDIYFTTRREEDV